MADLKPTIPQCPQCGQYHPPLAEGEECSLARKLENEDANEQMNSFMRQMKSILVNNIEKKEINNYNKFFGNLVVKLTKEIENYQD